MRVILLHPVIQNSIVLCAWGAGSEEVSQLVEAWLNPDSLALRVLLLNCSTSQVKVIKLCDIGVLGSCQWEGSHRKSFCLYLFQIFDMSSIIHLLALSLLNRISYVYMLLLILWFTIKMFGWTLNWIFKNVRELRQHVFCLGYLKVNVHLLKYNYEGYFYFSHFRHNLCF